MPTLYYMGLSRMKNYKINTQYLHLNADFVTVAAVCWVLTEVSAL